MRIAIIGYGRMGHEIEAIALERGHEVVLKIDKDNMNELIDISPLQVDVALEFTTPSTALSNVVSCLKAGVPIVCGTTGWSDKLDEVKSLVKENNGTLFWASNFNLGVNLFFLINRMLSNHLNEIGGYGVGIEEIHHTKKLDAPSGTAISLANIILKELDSYNGWTLLPVIEEDKIPIKAIREGDIPGTHKVSYHSSQDEITLTHRAKSRRGFALGAVLAAEYSIGKKGFLTMDSFLKI